jgi:type I restriction enzyme S subunit
MRGVAGQQRVPTEYFYTTILSLPPLSEQQLIVEEIEKQFTKTKLLKEHIIANQQATKDLLKALLFQAFETKETPIENTKGKIVPFTPKICNEPEKAILAGHIINTTNNQDFGRVKFQKLLHLTEYFCKIDMRSSYVQKVAGPHDENLIKNVESTLKRLRFYEICQQGFQAKVNYTPLGSALELDLLFKERFKDEEARIETFLNKFKNSTWEQCEIISTLYAVWNNRIIRQQPITDDLLKQDFLNWDKNKVKYKDRLDNALSWMKNKIIIPDGWGKYIGKSIE